MSKVFPLNCIQNEGNMLNIDKVEARMDWKRRDVLTRNYLVSTIESQQQKSLVNCRTANEMWTRLSAQHLRNAVENQHVLQQRFFEYQYQPDHVPDLGANLLSIAAVTELGMTVHSVESLVNFNTFDKTVIVGKRIGRTFYHLAITANPSDE